MTDEDYITHSDWEDFEMWARNQPRSHLPYSRATNFLANLMNCSKSEAELALADLQERNLIKIIQLHKDSGRRVFLRPLTAMTIEVVRSVWDGSPRTTKDADDIAAYLHDRTGHDVPEIQQYLEHLDAEGFANLNDGFFKWAATSSDEDVEEL